MDLETENRIAAILMKDAAELRRQAQSEGALAYLREPAARFRPNSRFLTATVRGVQQANHVVEVNEMWRIREKQLELDNRLRGSRNESSTRRSYKDECDTSRSRNSSCNELTSRNVSPSLKKRDVSNRDLIEVEGLRDDEVDKFLHSRTKRGRGAVGSRMDETGPYLPSCQNSKTDVLESTYEKKKPRVLLGPDKPYYLKSIATTSSDDEETCRGKKRKAKRSSSKQNSKKRKSDEKSRDKKKNKRKEIKSKYHG